MDVKNDSLIQAATATTVARPATGSVTSGNFGGSPLPAAAPLEPAARVRLSEAVRGQRATAEGTEVTGEVFDLELVRQIQEQIKEGTFKIDYDSVAKDLLQDALALTRKPQSGVTL